VVNPSGGIGVGPGVAVVVDVGVNVGEGRLVTVGCERVGVCVSSVLVIIGWGLGVGSLSAGLVEETGLGGTPGDKEQPGRAQPVSRTSAMIRCSRI